MSGIFEVKSKTVTVIGLGESGLAAALLLDDRGARVKVTEEADTEDVRRNIERLEHRGIEVEAGAHTKDFIAGSDLVVASPGVEDAAPPIRWATEERIPVIGEMELGFRFCEGRIIGITGTNGKSTVTTLIGEILSDAGFTTVVCGNIGNALSGEVDRITKDHWVVLEVSSFQLERIEAFRPAIAIILNITDDHQDRYADFRQYFNEKLKIFLNQKRGDHLILNGDAPYLKAVGDGASSQVDVLTYSARGTANGAFVKDGSIFVAAQGRAREAARVDDILLKGSHNVENVLASCLAGALAGADVRSMRSALGKFKGLAHRCETVGIVRGVTFVDDSKGTTVDSTLRALESSETPVVLIAGGRDKRSDYSVVREAVKKKVKALVLIGEARGKIRAALGDLAQTVDAKTMEEAVASAFALASRGEAVLLSPMCSSFDMFKNYSQRGAAFVEAVKGLGPCEKVNQGKQ